MTIALPNRVTPEIHIGLLAQPCGPVKVIFDASSEKVPFRPYAA